MVFTAVSVVKVGKWNDTGKSDQKFDIQSVMLWYPVQYMLGF